MGETPKGEAVDSTAEELTAPDPAEAPVEPAVEPSEAGGDPEAAMPDSTALVVSEERGVFEVMDAHDEQQILEALQGRILDVSLYDFSSGGKRQTELSYKGVRDCVFEMNRTQKCRIGSLPETLQTATIVEDGETWYEAVIFCRDEVSGATYSGYAREPRLLGSAKKVDPFAKTKAINKAERNALRKFVPEKIAQVLIAQFLKDENRVRQIQSEGPMVGSVAELPPANESEAARALVAECEAIFTEIKKLSNWRRELDVARFQAWKQRAVAQNPDDPEDVSKLEDFKEYLLGIKERLDA